VKTRLNYARVPGLCSVARTVFEQQDPADKASFAVGRYCSPFHVPFALLRFSYNTGVKLACKAEKSRLKSGMEKKTEADCLKSRAHPS
jgi:hypothetical protein